MNPFGAYRGSAAAQTTAQQWGNARGGELIGQGISQGGEALARGIEQMKALSTEAKSLRQLAKVYDPENAAKYDAMGLGELRGAVKGYAVKQAMEEHRSRMDAAERDKQQRAAFESAIGMAGNMANRDAGLQAGRNIVQGFSGGGWRGGMAAMQAAGNPELQNKVPGADEMMRAAVMSRSDMMFDRALRAKQAQGGAETFYNRDEIGKAIPVEGHPNRFVIPKGPRDAQYVEDTTGGSVAVRDESGRILGYQVGKHFFKDQTQARQLEAIENDIAHLEKQIQMYTPGAKATAGARTQLEELRRRRDAILFSAGGGAPASGSGDWQDLGNGYRFQTVK